MLKLTPIRHTRCNKIVAYYVGDKNEPEVKSKDIFYLDGSKPKYGSQTPECPYCGFLSSMGHLKRCFDEDVTPDFDVDEATKNPVYK